MGLKSLFKTGSGAVKRDAMNAAAARQGRAGNLTTLIDQTFSAPGREAGVVDFMGALRQQLGDATQRGFTDSARRTKFQTARQGLTGGRVDVDRQARGLEDLFSRQISNESAVQDAGNQLRDQDTATRQSLIGSAYGAADVGQEGMRSLIGQNANLANSRRSLLPRTVVGAGSAWGDNYSASQDRREYNRGLATPVAGVP